VVNKKPNERLQRSESELANVNRAKRKKESLIPCFTDALTEGIEPNFSIG
jgi:hypothetical protein